MDSVMCLIRSMLQLLLDPLENQSPLHGLTSVMGAIASHSARPRYTFMVLDFINRVADERGQAGPYVSQGRELVPIREWLASVMAPTAARNPHRRATVKTVRQELAAQGILPAACDEAEQMVAEHVANRIRASGMTAVSRAVSELVRAGLIKRHYQGFRIDHENRGAQRQAVYTVTKETLAALGQN